VGPYFTIGLCRDGQNRLVDDGVRLLGRVLDGNGEPIGDAMLEIWQDGRWGRAGTDRDGRYEFTIAEPTGAIAMLVFARGLLRHVATRVYVEGIEDDVLAAVDEAERATLVAQRKDGALHFDVRLQGDRQTVFFAV
jgi:protocatechuate 3,4-dioxygenase alpha subunit